MGREVSVDPPLSAVQISDLKQVIDRRVTGSLTSVNHGIHQPIVVSLLCSQDFMAKTRASCRARDRETCTQSQDTRIGRHSGTSVVDSFQQQIEGMNNIAVIAAATIGTNSYAESPKPIVFRCENPEVQFSLSTLVINERTGEITQTWNADGYQETNQVTFEDGVWSWKVLTDEAAGEQGIVNDMRLDRRTGIVSAAIEGKFEPEPNGEVCHLVD